MKKTVLLLVVLVLLLTACTSPAEGSEETSLLPVENQTVGEPEENETNVSYLKSKVNGLNVRVAPDTTAPAIGSLDSGDMVAYCGKEGDWYETVYRDQKAYLFSSYAEVVKLSPADDDTEAVIGLGCRLLGTPYVYGATRLHDGKGNFLPGFSNQRFDCSSLMQYLFFYGKGALLDLTTRTQVKQGISVPLEKIARGDLLFFTNSARKNNVGLERIGHVALYLGDGYILHTASDHATVERLSLARKKNLLFARRIG